MAVLVVAVVRAGRWVVIVWELSVLEVFYIGESFINCFDKYLKIHKFSTKSCDYIKGTRIYYFYWSPNIELPWSIKLHKNLRQQDRLAAYSNRPFEYQAVQGWD